MVKGHAYAEFWHRVRGALLDFLVLLPAVLVVYGVAFAVFDGDDRWLVAGLISWPLSTAYYVIGNGRGGTLGKRWAGLRVVDATGAAPGMKRALVRAIPSFGVGLLGLVNDLAHRWWGLWSPPLDYVSLLLPLDDLWMIWDRRKQTLHDKLAGTFVVVESRVGRATEAYLRAPTGRGPGQEPGGLANRRAPVRGVGPAGEGPQAAPRAEQRLPPRRRSRR